MPLTKCDCYTCLGKVNLLLDKYQVINQID